MGAARLWWMHPGHEQSSPQPHMEGSPRLAPSIASSCGHVPMRKGSLNACSSKENVEGAGKAP